MGDFLEKISPSSLYKDFEWASAQFRKDNQGPSPKLTKGHSRLVGLSCSHAPESGNHNIHQIM